MIDEGIKLEEYFKEEIKRVSDLELKQIDDDIAQIKEQSLEEMRLELEKEETLLREQEMLELKKEHAIALSKLQEETNRKLMQKRQTLHQAIFKEVRQRLEQFVQSDAYEAYIIEKIKKLPALTDAKITFYVAPHDEKYADVIKKAFAKNCACCVDASITIGGFRVECEEQGITMDDTFDASLHDQKEWFYTNSGLFIK